VVERRRILYIVHEVWNDQQFLQESGVQRRLVWKLKMLKQRVKLWAKQQRLQKHLKLEKLEEDLQASYQEKTWGVRRLEVDCHIKSLEEERNKLLLAEEELWRQRSRAIWIKSGDQNTKFFHQFASFRRNNKHIWEVLDENGQVHFGQEALKKEANRHFKSFFEESGHSTINDQVLSARLYPRLVNEEDTLLLERPCTKEELWEVLKVFAKDKSLGPDGWTVEFFIHFFDLVGDDLLEVVEDSRNRGEVVRALNSTFLALIPKVNKPTSFGDFRPIALCNLCYKLIAKIIANRIKPILSRTLSGEQLGFLKGRQILDAIGTTQECLHSIKMKNLKALILKLDLKKAYDCINWDYLRLTLIQTGFGLLTTNWIMSCVISATYAV
jgi:hypothetical protein